PLSCILYIIFINSLEDAVLACPGVRMRVREGSFAYSPVLRLLLFADDCALLAEGPRELQGMLDAVQRHANANSYRFNILKSKVMVTPRSMASARELRSSGQLRLDGSVIELVREFRYLGVIISFLPYFVGMF